VLLGLGSILGTGVFVSSGIAAGVAGPAVIVAVALAALVATCNALSSAQLAASHPVSGGTYEYGYRYLTPSIGFVAGWMFLCAKSASAATAALGLAGYVLGAIGGGGHVWRTGLGVSAVVVLTMLVAGGIRRSNRTNAVIVAVTLVALLGFILAGLPSLAFWVDPTPLTERPGPGPRAAARGPRTSRPRAAPGT
jgi:APA family basic amino acid/polyamine antiporter